MPGLGGLLKKRRTKDSQTLSKELESGSSSSAAQTQTSPNSADDHHHHHNEQTLQHQHSATSNTSNNSAASSAQPHNSSNDNPNRSSGTDKNSEGHSASMQSAVTQPHPSSHHNSGLHHLQQHQQQQQQQPQQQQHSHHSKLHNLLHPSHHGSSQASAGGHTNSQQANQAETRTTKGKYSLDDFTIQRTLGTGSFGRVHLVQSKHNHRFYAIKVLKKAQVVKMKQVEHTNDERRMLNRVRHPFLITLWGTWQDARNLYMVMDFVEGGELFSLLRKSQVSALYAPPCQVR
jgi:protein kinase A